MYKKIKIFLTIFYLWFSNSTLSLKFILEKEYFCIDINNGIKENLMETIRINDSKKLNLINSAVQRELSIIQSAIKITENRLKEIEEKFNMSSEVFFKKYLEGNMGDSMDTMLWAAECQAIKKLNEDYIRLTEVKFVT
jgi:hypothetical protein